MSQIDALLEKAGSEFRNRAAQLPEEAWKIRSARPIFGVGVALAAGIAVLVLIIPVALWLGTGEEPPVLGESSALRGTADVVFEGEDWTLGIWEEAIADSNDLNFCWEFNAIGRGPSGTDVTDSGCHQRAGQVDEDVSVHYGELRIPLEGATVWVLEHRPGEGGQIEVQTGRTSARHEGQKMPLSRADVFAFEDPTDNPHNSITFIPSYRGVDTMGRGPNLTGWSIRPDK